ncbi:MAG: hypothetical protein VXZ82_24265 [Planctomycetota bacterium]|mgnify:CR=1 FL=1|nr:hypothetical protein [Planctomycetota bacterium]
MSEPDPERKQDISEKAVHPIRIDKRGMFVFQFDDLCKEQPAILLEQDGILYELRKTRNGKLVLSR